MFLSFRFSCLEVRIATFWWEVYLLEPSARSAQCLGDDADSFLFHMFLCIQPGMALGIIIWCRNGIRIFKKQKQAMLNAFSHATATSAFFLQVMRTRVSLRTHQGMVHKGRGVKFCAGSDSHFKSIMVWTCNFLVLVRFWLITEAAELSFWRCTSACLDEWPHCQAYLVLKDPERLRKFRKLNTESGCCGSRRRIYDECGFACFKQSESCRELGVQCCNAACPSTQVQWATWGRGWFSGYEQPVFEQELCLRKMFGQALNGIQAQV